MKHCGTQRLETDRLVLRRFAMADVDVAFNNWTSDEQVTTFLRWPTHIEIGITENILKEWIANYEKPDFYQWAIVPKDLNEPIGTISNYILDIVLEVNGGIKVLHQKLLWR